jgi:hypothetical protein
LTRIASDNLAKQISSSWLIGDNSSYDTEYEQMAAQGQTFFQASGDNGAYYNGIPEWADDPNITIVGGTTLNMNGAGSSYASETVWNWYSTDEGAAASGGGVNFNHISIPTWQIGINTGANDASTIRRNVPDVAMNADNIYTIADNGQQFSLGGTSAASPLWAAFNALVNQRATIFGHATMGFLNPTLYTIGKSAGYVTNFNDIKTGNNSTPEVSNKYNATTGYDLCTGWGSPIGSNMLNTLVPPDTLTVAPLGSFGFAGPSGGPFMPATLTFILANAGSNSMNWTLNNTSSWLNASITSGTLAASETTNVVISANAIDYAIGTYMTSIQFSNANSHETQTMPFSMNILDPMAIGQPGNFSASGPFGGPFNPSNQTYSITNISGNPFTWSLNNIPSWLDASVTNGELAGYSTTNVVVTFDPSAASLLIGTYSTNLVFTNWDAQTSQTFPVSLQVIEPLTVTPAGNYSANGVSGGPFNMTSADFVLSNLGEASLSWGLVNTSAWLNVQAPNGVLSGDEETNISVSLDMDASNLVNGVYNTTLTFVDQTLGNSQSRQFTLIVGQSIVLNGGFETGDFTDWTLDGDAGTYDYVDDGSTVTAIQPHTGSYFAALGESGFQAYLTQTLPTLPGRPYLLSLWMNSPNWSPYEPNEFSVAWNGNKLFDQVNIPPITNPSSGWTNLEFIVTATNDASVLQIGGRDDNYYLGLDDVSVVPLPLASLQTSLAATANGISFSWNAMPGVTYQVQYTTNLSPPDWIVLQTISATNTPITFTDTNSITGSSQKYYRLLLTP